MLSLEVCVANYHLKEIKGLEIDMECASLLIQEKDCHIRVWTNIGQQKPTVSQQ